MRGLLEVHAIGRDVASPSPLRLKSAPALDMMRYQRLSPDCLPLANGGGSGVARKPASRSSFKDDDAATDGSRLASYLAASQPDSSSKPARARAPPPQTATARSPARDHAHGDSSDTASPSSNAGDVLLQWGHNKRSRCRRDASSSSSAAPSPQRRLSSGGVNGKIQRRASAPTEKLMPPPPAATAITRGSNLRSASSFPARAAGGDANHHGNNRSVEERSGGAQKRQSPDKAHSKAAAVDHMDPKNSNNHHHPYHHHNSDSPLVANGGGGEKLGAVERFELPRIYISLSRKEKEDDFLAMKGTKLPQRPKKRAKNVDKSLQFVFPGMWLSDLTRSRYEVREKKCVKKRRRGLKGMESMDSDSE
ncbi:serine/arginine repetitive matrix protein 1 [Brachypodium distachyon]|uniref:DUF1639 domain-containing protein n=1 Tax=Brachypodium distachyon TaxID=15368 RepID=I1HQE4_BRADI|nr:serine/arginine repetitive matrix protein 1 [Brachypodium distachyon]KQK09197.1 hypothetical protein BRADI_2g46620v3 [Brachypodium distachyon]|eukprot:XP_003569564.1 serine/arginine repetitive matrix protein 1 [Brachypodium distachyon]